MAPSHHGNEPASKETHKDKLEEFLNTAQKVSAKIDSRPNENNDRDPR
jgi:hypothetical protein